VIWYQYNDLVDLGCYEHQGLTGIECVNTTNSFKAYFSSTRNNLIVDIKLPVKSIVISDLAGKILITKNIAGTEDRISFDLRNLSNGIYLLSAGNSTQKLIVY